MEYKYSFYCDQGKRSNNQDACYVAENGNNQLLAIVCDGVGSEKHSEIASQSMVTTCANNFINFKDSDFKSFYVPSLKEARNTIVKTIEEEYSGKSSSTTVVCCMINKNKLSVAWLGDSRLYHYSKLTKEWKQITRDHNLLNFLNSKWDKISAKIISDPMHTEKDLEAAKKNRASQLIHYKSQLASITECLDNVSDSYLNSEYAEIEINSGDIVFLCSDGVYQWISPNNVYDIVKENPPSEWGKKTVELALKNNSNDNCTAIVIRVDD